MDDRSEAKLRGPVRTSRSEHVFHETAIVRSESYLPDGRLNQTSFRNADNWESRTIYTYNADGQLRQQASWNGDVSGGTRENHYDQQARLIRVTSHMPNGTETIIETMSYQPQGQKTVIRYIPDWSFTTPQGTTVGIDTGDGGAIFLAEDAATVTTVYDEQGRAQQSIAHDRQHQIVATVDRNYGEQGRLSEVSTTIHKTGSKHFSEILARASDEERVALEKALDQFIPQGRPMNRTTFRYDDQGRIIERSTWMHQLSFDRVLTTYNEQGDEQTATTYHEGRELRLTEEGTLVPAQPNRPSSPPSESKFVYLYDEHGNWTARRLVSHGQFQYVDKRELTYW